MNEFSLEVDAEPGRLRDIACFVEQTLDKLEISEEARGELCMAIDEAVTNIILYGYPAGKGKIRITLTQNNSLITAEIIDQGIPFDPTKQPEPDLSLSLENRPVGGMGIHLIRHLVDGFSYYRANNTNHLILTKKQGGRHE